MLNSLYTLFIIVPRLQNLATLSFSRSSLENLEICTCFQEMDSFTCDQNLSTAVAFGKPQLCSLQNDQVNFEDQIFGDISFPPLMNCSLFSHEDHESRYGESGRIDLNLGRIIVDQKDVWIASQRSEQKGGVSSLASFCKVYGCNKNLSSCKEYYKRHKVCEVHSKTSKVIVNGVEQRFCQQCSRFHLLREFDEGKRSCRKRLAGHNERRRKPHVGPCFERHGRLLPSYTISVKGNEFKESAGAISSFTNPNGLHIPYQQKQENKVRWDMNPQSSSGITDKQLHSTSVSPCNIETKPRFINGSVSSSESARSLLSSRSGSTSCYSSRTLTPNSKAHPVVLGSHDLKNPMVGFDDQVVRDESCMIDLIRLSAQLDRVEHQKRNAQVNPAN